MEGKYFFNGKDISMNLYIQIRDVVDIIMEKSHLSFPDAMGKFYHSRTYKTLQNTENTLWAESAGYIADRYYEEQEEANNKRKNMFKKELLAISGSFFV